MRYLTFAGAEFYAWGGWQDFLVATDDLEVATTQGKLGAENKGDAWWHVVDLDTRKIVRSGEVTPGR